MSDDDELTPAERMAFDELPREAAPPDVLEERIVGTLREERILRREVASPGTVPDTRRFAAFSRRPEAGLGWRRPWLVATASMAASLIVFVSGVLLGQWMGARSAERILLAVREQDNRLVAQRVQEAGSAYVDALAALAALGNSPAVGARGGVAVPSIRVASEIQQGSEAALGALYAAVLELDRLTPGDPEVAQILQILEDRRFPPASERGTTRTAWY